MGLRVAGVCIATSFLLGILFTHWIADSLTLWSSPLTDEHLRTAAIYYAAYSRLPISMLWVLVGVTGFGATCLLLSVRDGRAGNYMFDGASIFLYLSAVSVYWIYDVPNLNEIADKPLPPLLPNSSKIWQFPDSLRQPTVELASAHLMCSVALTGVMLFQALRHVVAEEDQSEREMDEKEERERERMEAERGRHRKVISSGEEEDEDQNSSTVTSSQMLKKSASARRRERSSGKGSVGRSSGSSLRRNS